MAGVFTGFGVLACAAPEPACPTPEFDGGAFPGALAHVRWLADDALEGRAVASAGERCSGEYIATFFESLGLEPAGEDGTYFQSFQVRTGSELAAPGSLGISPSEGGEGNPLSLDEGSFRPYGFSGSGTVEAAAVYGGAGVASSGEGAEPLPDVEGMVMVVEAATPDVPAGALYADPHFKGNVAQGRGASALVVLLEEGADLPDLASEDKPFLRIPIVAVSGTEAEAVRTAAQAGASTVRVEAQVQPSYSTARNVVALLPGTDPDRADEVLILGAHYDHLGYGGEGSLAPDAREIHNGADDNASGTAALLEVAEALAVGEAPARPVLFIAFSGEERGLLGSAHFVAEPTVAIDGALAMINMDMVGRVRDNTTTVFGMATAPEWEATLTAVNEAQDEPFNLTLMPDGYGPSDHSSFYGAGMPVLHFFSNTHSEYHRPEDDWETINGADLDRIATLVSDLTAELAGSGSEELPRLTLVESSPPSPTEEGASRGYGPYFGSIPDMGYQGFGVRLSGVREGGPAATAGLQAGDVIIAFGGQEVGDLYAYTYAMREMAPGDVVDVVIERDGQRLARQAVLGERR